MSDDLGQWRNLFSQQVSINQMLNHVLVERKIIVFILSLRRQNQGESQKTNGATTPPPAVEIKVKSPSRMQCPICWYVHGTGHATISWYYKKGVEYVICNGELGGECRLKSTQRMKTVFDSTTYADQIVAGYCRRALGKTGRIRDTGDNKPDPTLPSYLEIAGKFLFGVLSVLPKIVHASAVTFFRGVSARCSFTGPWSSGGSLTDATQRRAFSISGPSE